MGTDETVPAVVAAERHGDHYASSFLTWTEYRDVAHRKPRDTLVRPGFPPYFEGASLDSSEAMRLRSERASTPV